MRVESRRAFILLGLQLLGGCAGLTASIESRNVPGRSVDRAASFYFSVPEAASAEDRQTIQALIDEFRVRGLKVVSEAGRAEAGYAVAVAFVDKSTATTGSVPVSDAQTAMIRNVNGMAVGFVQTGTTTDVPYAATYRVRTVSVSVSAPDGVVWDGRIVSEANALSAHSRCIARELVRRLGVDYRAETRIDIACRSR